MADDVDEIDPAAAARLLEIEGATEPNEFMSPEIGGRYAEAVEPELVSKRLRIDVYHHFPDGEFKIDTSGSLKLCLDALVTLVDTTPPPPPPSTAVSARLAITNQQGESMAILTIDDNDNAVLTFDDRLDEPTAPPVGSGCTFASDNAAVATIGDAAETATGFAAPITYTGDGDFNLSAVLSNANKADGTPIADPAPKAVTVAAGAAVTATVDDVPAAPAAGVVGAGPVATDLAAPSNAAETNDPAGAAAQAEQPGTGTGPVATDTAAPSDAPSQQAQPSAPEGEPGP